MELKGKKIAFLGDSITEGCGTSSIDKTFWSIIAQRTGAECFGYGIGGTRIAPQKNVPEVVSLIPAIAFSKVVLPQPDGPTIAVKCPRGMQKFTSLSRKRLSPSLSTSKQILRASSMINFGNCFRIP